MGLLPLRCKSTGKARPFFINQTILFVMTYTRKSCLQEKNSNLSTTPAERNAARILGNEFTAEELKQSLISSYDLNFPVGELISTGEAVFEFVKISEMDLSTKNAFYQLEKQFKFYKRLVELRY